MFGDVDAGMASGGGCETIVVFVENAASVVGEVRRAEIDSKLVGEAPPSTVMSK